MEEERDKGKRVSALVVDEDEEIRGTLMERLQEAGYFTDVAANGKDAIDKFKEFFYNIALVEVELPDMTGLDFLKVIKSIHPDTSVIFITGKPSLENSVSALNAGANAYMMKPLKMEEMMEHVTEANFVDTPSMIAINRHPDPVSFSHYSQDGWLIIDTGKMKLEYQEGSDNFNESNLRITFQVGDEEVTWKPGTENTGNLGGSKGDLAHC